VPKPGENLTVSGLEVKILRADEKKIQLLRLRKAPAQGAAETEIQT
jgi:Mg2+/Co2+ transporter CorC